MKRNVLIVVDSLAQAGAESVAARIAAGLARSRAFEPVVCATRGGGPLEAFLKENGVEYFTLGRRHAYELHKLRPLAAAIRSKNIQVIHTHKMGSNLWGSLMGKLGRVPAIVSHVHGQRHTTQERATDRVMGAFSDRIVVVSEYERALFLHGRERLAGKVTLVYNGIDCGAKRAPDPARVRESLGLPPNAGMQRDPALPADAARARQNQGLPADASRLVGIVAGLRPEKAIHVFLLAASVVAKKIPGAHFIVVGDGPEMAQLRDAVSLIGLDGRCTFAGFRKDAGEIISILDCCVLSSLREGLPLVLLEYLARSKPVVATRVGGIPEVIEDGVNGFLVPKGDHQALAEKITAVLENPAMAAEMGEAGRRTCVEKFSLDAMVSGIETIYDEILAQKGRLE